MKVAGHVVEREKTVTKGLKVVGDSRMVAKLRPAVLTRTIQIVARMTEMSTDHRLTATGGGDDNRNRPQLLRCLRQTFSRASSSIFSHPFGNSTKICYNTFNAPVSVTDANGIVTKYAYNDARLVTRMERLDGSETLTFRAFMCHADGQLASANCGSAGGTRSVASETENFLWDDLALIQRGDEQFINEPHVGGGNPVASSKGTSYFNDVLGTTVGSKSNGKYTAAALTTFGESLETLQGEVTSNFKHQTSNSQNFFTGKPFVEGLGHAFLMRNYRAGLAKWQTSDPMGYPDGWNQFAYCNNGVTSAVDLWGCEVFDDAWELIFGHWMVGGGVELDLFYDEYFTSYMASNMLLRDQIEQWLMNFARGHESGRINLTRHAEIENGYLTGYELLHGTNATVGDFQIVGNYTSAIPRGKSRGLCYTDSLGSALYFEGGL